MKGLIIKDLMCLRKMMKSAVTSMIQFFVLSVLLILSCQFGNLKMIGQQMEQESGSGNLNASIVSLIMIIFFIVPIAVIGEGSANTIFKADKNAGFSIVGASLPVSVEKRVLARYITFLSLSGICLIINFAIAFVVTKVTDILTFGEIFGVIMTFISYLLIVVCANMFFNFLFGYGKEDVINGMIVVSTMAIVILPNIQKFMYYIKSDDELLMSEMLDSFVGFMYEKYYIALLIALLVIVLSYLGIVSIEKRKRGMI